MLDAIKAAKDEILEAIKALTEEEEVETPAEPEVKPEEVEAAKAKAIAEAAINLLGEAGYAPLELKESGSSAKPEKTREEFNAMDHIARNSFLAQGGKIK